MQFLYDAFQALLKAGAFVMLPVIITVVGLCLGMKITRAFRSGLTVGIGFVGIKLVIDMLAANIGPASKAMVENFGLQLDIIDVGWGAIASVTWASPIIPLLILTIFLMNVLLLSLRATDTLDVDIWNYHHMAIVGVLVYFVTDNIFVAVASAAVMAFITFKLSDWTSPLVERFFGIPNVSLPTMSFLSSVIIAYPMNWVLDRIPGVNKISMDLNKAQKYLGIFGESTMLGFILGCIIGGLAKYSVGAAFNLGVHMAAVMVLIPKMTSLFVEGLMPISEAATEFTSKRFKNRKFLIGLDAAVVVGDSRVITTALVLIPLTILMAAILPGNRVMPFADLAVITFRIALVVAIARGNVFRSILMGLVVMAAILYAGTLTSPVLTAVATQTGLDFKGQMISSFASVSMTISFLVYQVFINNLMITVPILLIALGVIYYFAQRAYKRAIATSDQAEM
ncbi:MAG: PTS galactitol transporter subunit IIC [Veillonella sp.]|uniref:PTS galactitol transporter subunit IIC n=1 Tax=Veillonella sp. TaxID=1926307 RepID=UPI0025E893E6|nr:PTS transporter subunit IIC [Veillonella sp.]MBS4912995.1 PTS galactitol transporter subunit IIC [Veillonella sp.]